MRFVILTVIIFAFAGCCSQQTRTENRKAERQYKKSKTANSPFYQEFSSSMKKDAQKEKKEVEQKRELKKRDKDFNKWIKQKKLKKSLE